MFLGNVNVYIRYIVFINYKKYRYYFFTSSQNIIKQGEYFQKLDDKMNAIKVSYKRVFLFNKNLYKQNPNLNFNYCALFANLKFIYLNLKIKFYSNRLNVVLSRQADFDPAPKTADVIVCKSLEVIFIFLKISNFLCSILQS